MERLRDQAPGSDPALREAVRLVRGVERYQPSAEARARLLRELEKTPPPTARPPWLTAVPVVLVVGGLLWLARSRDSSDAHVANPPVAVVPATTAPLPSPAPRPAVDPPAAEPTSPAAPAEVIAPPPAPRPDRTRAHSPPAHHASASPAPAPASADDAGAALVLAATRALRFDHDAERADLLLADYLTRYPSGLLVEQALWLRIQAAQRLGAGLPEAVSTYLRRFPDGQWAAQAHAALEAAATH